MARKSRVFTAKEKQSVSKSYSWNIAIYIRLSREDLRSNDESESIINQRKIDLEFIEENFCTEQYQIVDIYIDDGRSGTTEDTRPDFQRLCKDIEEKKVNCVVCKTLSRAFRNYADQGKFLEQFLPAYGCRFIAVSNPFVDTFTNPDCTQNMEIPINGLMNDRYAAKTSQDVRRTFETKRKKGEFIGAFAPYGYQKNPYNKNSLVIDDEAAETVKEIYSLYLNGMSKNSIVHYLNDRGIPCPALYKQKKQGLKYQNPHLDPSKKPLWSYHTIHNILKNPMYCGDMVQGRYRIKSYKVHVQEKVSEDEWFIVENTHEAIIDKETFRKVESLLKKDTRISPKNDTLYLFSGFLRCADCGRAMVRSQVKGNVYYYCSTYKSLSKKACTKHSIRHDALEKAVLYIFQLQIYFAIDYTKTMEKLNKTPRNQNQLQKLAIIIRQREQELKKIRGYKQALYQDWKDLLISKNDYLQMKNNYEKEEDILREILLKLQAERKEKEIEENTEAPFLSAFRKYKNITELSRDLLIEFIDCIKVYEDGNISITFRFSDPFKCFSDNKTGSPFHSNEQALPKTHQVET